MNPTHIQARTIHGVCYLSAADIAAALRQRADEVEAQAGDDPYGADYMNAVAYHAIAHELRERAAVIEFGVIEHLTEHPGDSGLVHDLARVRAEVAEEIAEAIEAKAAELRGVPFRSGPVSIEYACGVEGAASIAREHRCSPA